MKSLFITGTDTDCGKTFVTAGILSGFVSMGINAVPAKPVQTGCTNGVSEDLEFSLKTAGLSFPKAVKNRLCPCRFTPACSPHLAAKLAGTAISAAAMASSLKEIQSRFQCVVAEGAGGILVPLGGGKTMLDLMILLNWPVVLVSSDKLGTINHTLLSLEALRHAELDVAGVVVNHATPPSTLISRSNTETIKNYGRTKILAEIPHSPDCFPAQSFQGICTKLKGILS
ncbi:MAG: dethiobiotin synthase [Candidatus Fermentibacteraceae bacterium]|nr:dethiobiotin synthase [Candidatus Fermentibacteraceae bacterium]